MNTIRRFLRSVLLFPLTLMFGAVTHNTNTIGGNMSAENKTFYDRTLLKRLKPLLVFQKYGQKRPIPKHEGGTINFRRYAALPANTTALTEGVTPAGTQMSVSTVTATPKQYGGFITVSDKLDMQGIDPNITEASELCGDQAGLSLDTVIRDVVCAGSNVHYAAGTSRAEVAAANVLSSALLKKAVRTLRRQNVKPLEGGFYIGIIHPDTEYDLQHDDLWVDVSKYNGGEAIVAGEIGKMCGVKFVTTTNAPIFEGEGDSDADVYGTMIIGADAYGIVDIEGEGQPRIIVKDASSGGTEDPLEQRSTIAWKAFMTAVRLNELAMIRIEHGATAV